MKTFTCENCPDRYPGCHGYCKKYKRELENLHKAKEYLRAERDFDNFEYENTSRTRRKNRKR